MSNKYNTHNSAINNGNVPIESWGGGIDQSTTKAFFVGVAATSIVLGGVAGINHLTTPEVIAATSVAVKNGNKPGPEVCGAVSKLAEEHGLTANTAACLDGLRGVTLADGTEIEVAFTGQKIGVTGSSIVVNKRWFTTSIDNKINEER